MKTNTTDIIRHLQSLQKVAIAFSGGVDSSLLAYLAGKALKGNAHIYTIVTPYMAKAEIAAAKAFARKHELNHHIIEVDTPQNISNNPTDRCYLCKHVLFSTLQQEARKLEINIILDGSNADDLNDYRPGMKALKELEVRSPFLELNITKEEVREMSKELQLSTWNTPSNPCLLTRLPYNKCITENALRQVEKAEEFLHNKGFREIRVRHEGETARIEVPSNEQNKLISSPLREEILIAFTHIGFTFVAFDLKGFKSGNMNQTLSSDSPK